MKSSQKLSPLRTQNEKLLDCCTHIRENNLHWCGMNAPSLMYWNLYRTRSWRIFLTYSSSESGSSVKIWKGLNNLIQCESRTWIDLGCFSWGRTRCGHAILITVNGQSPWIKTFFRQFKWLLRIFFIAWMTNTQWLSLKILIVVKQSKTHNSEFLQWT